MKSKAHTLIDFTELISAVPGEGLQELTRHLGKNLELSPEWSGRGADGGRDLLFTDTLTGKISHEKLRWLVSCKDKSKSGDSVSERDLPTSIKDKLLQHNAQGFLLVTTTTVSTGAKQLLDSLDKPIELGIHIAVWDSSELIRLLLKSENEACLKQFLPESYQRVKGISNNTVDAALEIIRQNVASGIYENIVKLLENQLLLHGLSIWPHDPQIAYLMEHIATILINRSDFDMAVELTYNIEYDAFISFSSWLVEHHPQIHYQYLYAIATKSFDGNLIYNAVQLLLDYHEIYPSDWITLADSIDEDSLNELFPQKISLFVIGVVHEGYKESEKLEFYKQIFNICEAYDIDGIYIDQIALSRIDKQHISFDGRFKLRTTLWRETGSITNAELEGTYSGIINKKGIFMNSLSLDISKFSK